MGRCLCKSLQISIKPYHTCKRENSIIETDNTYKKLLTEYQAMVKRIYGDSDLKSIQFDDAIFTDQPDRCELCGGVVTDSVATDRIKDARVEILYRFAERILWDDMSAKAIGTMLRVICAATLLPSASTRQIGAAVGVSHVCVVKTKTWLKENTPDIYSALWRAG